MGCWRKDIMKKTKTAIVPAPRSCRELPGRFTGKKPDVVVACLDASVRPVARMLADKLGLAYSSGNPKSMKTISLHLVDKFDFTASLRPEQLVEAHSLEVSSHRVSLLALTVEGLIRASASLLQLAKLKDDLLHMPCVMIEDWPEFRQRGAADWLVNVEMNRWAYDQGDGPEAALLRVRRGLDFCFEHKINFVWFDGYGWDARRAPGYARFMRECNRYARQYGIKLEFGGCGGGYGTVYQAGELYRSPYFGKVPLNRRSYPEGEVYECRGWGGGPNKPSRIYGTCLSNTRLRRIKIEEIVQYVKSVEPGFLYIHDIDSGLWLQTVETWNNRCPACRKRWPDDAPDSMAGLAGAFAEWIRSLKTAIQALPEKAGYLASRDLTLAFVSPLYTGHEERRPEDVWEREMHYYECLSRAVGPGSGCGIVFGLREQFYAPDGEKKIVKFRKRLDAVGNGHGIFTCAFVGGDNYFSDDLTTVAGSLAHFFEGSHAVMLSNGQIHQSPITMLNAQYLWSGDVDDYRAEPATEKEVDELLENMRDGLFRPGELFASRAAFERFCIRRWGQVAGRAMSRALSAKYEGQGPVNHVWWSITKTLSQLVEDNEHLPAANVFPARAQATRIALRHALKAAAATEDAEVHSFVKYLEVGGAFARSLDFLFRLKAGEAEAAALLKVEIRQLKGHIRKHFPGPSVDALGGDPGCWDEAIKQIEQLAHKYRNNHKAREITGNFNVCWKVSEARPLESAIAALKLPSPVEIRSWRAHTFHNAFCDVSREFAQLNPAENVVFCVGTLRFTGKGEYELRIGHDAPVKVWLNGEEVFCDPAGTNPGKVDKVVVPVKPARRNCSVTIALASNGGKGSGFYLRPVTRCT